MPVSHDSIALLQLADLFLHVAIGLGIVFMALHLFRRK